MPPRNDARGNHADLLEEMQADDRFMREYVERVPGKAHWFQVPIEFESWEKMPENAVESASRKWEAERAQTHWLPDGKLTILIGYRSRAAGLKRGLKEWVFAGGAWKEAAQMRLAVRSGGRRHSDAPPVHVVDPDNGGFTLCGVRIDLARWRVREARDNSVFLGTGGRCSRCEGASTRRGAA